MLTPPSGVVDTVVQICASILGREGWSPVLTVIAICITIQSMLASCKVGISSIIGTSYLLLQYHRRKNRQPPMSVYVSGLTERVYPRPSDNDRYVPRAPENPKKVSIFLIVSLRHAYHVAQARFHYHGMCCRNATQGGTNVSDTSIKMTSTDIGSFSLLNRNADCFNSV